MTISDKSNPAFTGSFVGIAWLGAVAVTVRVRSSEEAISFTLNHKPVSQIRFLLFFLKKNDFRRKPHTQLVSTCASLKTIAKSPKL